VLVRVIWTKRKASLRYPLQPAPRTAVLVPWFRSRDPIRVFAEGWNEDAQRFAPQAIAATLPQLEALAGVVPVSHATIVLRREGEPRLAEAEREWLWQGFHVPAFEQIIRCDGTLFAAECEAHNGLHLESPKFSADDHEIDLQPCACGRTTPRLLSGERLEVLRHVATYAR
jgi:hypothetical protein